MQNRRIVYVAECRLMTSCQGRMKTFSLFVLTVALNLIFGPLSARFKCNNNVER